MSAYKTANYYSGKSLWEVDGGDCGYGDFDFNKKR